MHVVRNPDGSLSVSDEPLRLDGRAAERFLEEMERQSQITDTDARRRFLAKCEQVYRETEEKRTK